MSYVLEAAVGCNTGKIRKNNEDNFFFSGRILSSMGSGLKNPLTMEEPLKKEICLAVFDGMGGESFGELASYAAADTLRKTVPTLRDRLMPKGKYLDALCQRLNCEVVAKARELGTERMGSTLVLLSFRHRSLTVCNLGDSRAYRLRDGAFLQLTVDHVVKQTGGVRRKMPLTQHLGIDPEELLLEPYIAEGKLERGDQYLLSSDGLTDMLTDQEISEIMGRAASSEEAVRELIENALEKGGRDNVTAIVCRIR
ncbi:MAG: serine/threonine-protein phosphatase [Lachnospiraceae bacterium]|nr:serine/threonine-protein phosphatase [Lachnospiraceae bacterium]